MYRRAFRAKYGKDPEQHKNNWRKHMYGITSQDYDRMCIEQKDCCALCLKPAQKSLRIDHCHATGRVRGLLCSPCNMWLGRIDDDVAAPDRVRKYLEAK